MARKRRGYVNVEVDVDVDVDDVIDQIDDDLLISECESRGLHVSSQEAHDSFGNKRKLSLTERMKLEEITKKFYDELD